MSGLEKKPAHVLPRTAGLQQGGELARVPADCGPLARRNGAFSSHLTSRREHSARHRRTPSDSQR